MYRHRTLLPAISAVFLILARLPAWAVAPTVTNVQAHQWQDDTRKVQITYYLTDPDSASVYVSVAISTDGGSTYGITPSHITGDIGWVRTGGTRTIVWDAKAQYPDAVWTSCKAKVTADDSSGGVYPGTMVYIPAGGFDMGTPDSWTGSHYSDEHPQHWVSLSGYSIGKYEVTRGEYRRFKDAGGYSNPAYWSSAGWSWKVSNSRTQPYCWAARTCFGHGEGGCDPATCSYAFTQTENHPVVGVSYYESEAFCNWAGGHLATEAQWEKAARWTGTYPNVYPWGNTWDAEKCNNYYDHNPAGGGYARYQTAPVGSYPSGVSPYGCQDMAGNVWEWAKDWYLSNYYSLTPPGGWSDPQGPSSGGYRVLRGGNWSLILDSYGVFRCAFRYYYFYPYGYSSYFGFRFAR